MDALRSVLGALPVMVGAHPIASLIIRWTVLLGVVWALHAVLAGWNPRWRVALWRGAAVGIVAILALGGFPPVVRYPLAGTKRLVVSARANSADIAAIAGSSAGASTRQAASEHERPEGSDVVRGPEAAAAMPVRSSGASGIGGVVAVGKDFSRTSFRLGPWILGFWAAGFVVLTFRYLWGIRRLSAIIRRSELVSDTVLADLGALTTMPAVCVRRSTEVQMPCLARAWRPVLLLPDWQNSDHDRSEMRAILAHELAHARGHDLIWNDALHWVSVLLWFHPLVWRAREAHVSACDAVCDAVAADQLGDVAAYNQVLARLAVRAAGIPHAGGLAMARVSDVRRRIESLNRHVFRASIPWRLTVPATLAFGLGVFVIGGLGFTVAGQGSAPDGRGERAPLTLVARRPETPVQTQPAAGPQGKAPSTTPAATLSLSATGTVVDSGGKPIAGATVILREWSVFRVRGMSSKETERFIRGEELPDTLAQTTAGPDGRFRFEGVPAPAFPQVPEAGRSVFPWDVVALAPGHGLAWMQLTPQQQRAPITLTLGDEGVLRGRIVEPSGMAIEGAKVKVFGIDPLGRPVDNGLGTDNRLNLIWSAFPLGAKTDAAGQFTIQGLPRDRIVTLIVTDSRHERLLAYNATTDAPQPDNVSRIFRSGQAEETRQPVYTGPFTLTAKRSDHVLTGRVRFEADGKPAAGATLLVHAKNYKADEDGKYRIEGLTSGLLEVHAIAWPSHAAPVDIVVELPEEPREFTRDLSLPPGLILRGRVVDELTGRGVEKATLSFSANPEKGRTPTLFGFRKETDSDGRFRLVVPPGRGKVELNSVPQSFPPLPRRAIGSAADPQYSREVEGKAGQTVEVAEFRLARAPGMVLRVVDPAGRPVVNARVEARDMDRWPRNEPGRTDAEGRYEAVGLSPRQVTVFDITAEDPPLGATVELDAEQGGGQPKTVEIRLQPLVSLSGRVLDEDGRPLAGPVVQLYRNVTYPGQSGRSFGMPIDTRNEVAADGAYTFDRLIPGATYSTHVEAGGHATATSQHVRIKPGEPVKLDDFRLPVIDQEVRGVVVNERGKPLAGVSVSYQRADRTRALYAPRGSTWFLDTDATGRFHLIGLPRGPIRLMAYRRPEGADMSIRNMKYVDVPPGQAEVRIELPDPNARLRGIE